MCTFVCDKTHYSSHCLPTFYWGTIFEINKQKKRFHTLASLARFLSNEVMIINVLICPRPDPKEILVFHVYYERPMVIYGLNLKLRQIARLSSNVILNEMLSAKCHLLFGFFVLINMKKDHLP